MRKVRTVSPDELSKLANDFHDHRLQNLLPLYKARNYPKTLTQEERAAWDNFCQQKLLSGDDHSRAAQYFARIAELAATNPSKEQQYVLEELRLYGESILAADVAD